MLQSECVQLYIVAKLKCLHRWNSTCQILAIVKSLESLWARSKAHFHKAPRNSLYVLIQNRFARESCGAGKLLQGGRVRRNCERKFRKQIFLIKENTVVVISVATKNVKCAWHTLWRIPFNFEFLCRIGRFSRTWKELCFWFLMSGKHKHKHQAE